MTPVRSHRPPRALLLATLTLGTLAAAPLHASTPAAPAIVIDPGANFVLGSNTRLVTPVNLINRGAFTTTLYSEVILTGTSALLVSGVPILDNLTLSMAGTAAIDVPTTIRSALTLNSGILSCAGHDLFAAGVLGGSASSYVMTPDTLGRFGTTISQYQPVLFPVGNSTYDPVTVQPQTNTDRFYVVVVDAPPAGPFPASGALHRAWQLSQANLGGPNGVFTLGLQWNSGESGSQFDRSFGMPTSAQAYDWESGAWIARPGVRTAETGPQSGPYVDTLKTSTLGRWTLASPAVLAVGPSDMSAPGTLALEQNSPNPCVRATGIRYGLPKRADVSLAVYTVTGARVATLAQGEQEPGWHVATFNPGRLPGGMYFYRLESAGRTLSRKLIVVR